MTSNALSGFASFRRTVLRVMPLPVLLAASLPLQADPPRSRVIVHHQPKVIVRHVPQRPVMIIHDHSPGWRGRGWNSGPVHGYHSYAPRVVVAPRAHVAVRERDDAFRADYRGNGLVLGAIAGAIIGNNSGTLNHNAWAGAAWGAGVGYVLGSIAETNARVVAARQSAPEPLALPARPVSDAPRVPDAPQMQASATSSRGYASPATPMSAANSLFGR